MKGLHGLARIHLVWRWSSECRVLGDHSALLVLAGRHTCTGMQLHLRGLRLFSGCFGLSREIAYTLLR
jgi:hypothetical protein